MILRNGNFYATLDMPYSSRVMAGEWVSMLRDPKWVQVTGRLRSDHPSIWRFSELLSREERDALAETCHFGYCCLGVITERYLPTFWELRDIGVDLTDGSETLPSFMQKQLNLSSTGSFAELNAAGEWEIGSLANVNDRGATFRDIADIIERMYDESDGTIFAVDEIGIPQLSAINRDRIYAQEAIVGLFSTNERDELNAIRLGVSRNGVGLYVTPPLFTYAESWIDPYEVASRIDAMGDGAHGVKSTMTHDEVVRRMPLHSLERLTDGVPQIVGLWSDREYGITMI